MQYVVKQSVGIEELEAALNTAADKGYHLRHLETPPGASSTFHIIFEKGSVSASSAPQGGAPSGTANSPGGSIVSEKQVKRMIAIAHNKGWAVDNFKHLYALAKSKGVSRLNQCPKGEVYNSIIAHMEANKPGANGSGSF